MILTKSFLRGACLSFFGLLFLVETFLRLSVPTGFWYRHFDFSGDLTSLAELRDRIHFAAPAENRVLFLGDSVLGASALKEHRIPRARSKTLGRFLKKDLGQRGEAALSLGSDGMLLPDIEALTRECRACPPQRVLLLLNFRMFSKGFAEGPDALSRKFLLPDLPEDIRERLAPAHPPTQEARLSDELYEGLCGSWFLFRESQMAKTLWYYPSQKDFFQRQLERVVGRNETEAEIVEAALEEKVAPYYQPYLWPPRALSFTCLKRVLSAWADLHVPVTVVLTPQNRKFLGGYLDPSSFRKNRKTLADFLKPYAGRGVVYVDWVDRFPSTSFLDHCHMTPAGNERYAAELTGLLERGKP